jgi:gliding motility-associated-like protein
MTKINTISIVFLIASLITFKVSKGQLTSCDTNVPFHYVDLTGQPQGQWISPVHSRVGNCCGTSSPDNCTSFEVVLDSNAAAISFDFYSGAVPSGSMFFQIDCGPQLAVGEVICLTGVGPHRITFCKPGNNANEYIIKSISKPTFPLNDTTRVGCSIDFQVLGFELSDITWGSVFPGPAGAYDNLLSCTDSCDITTFTPTPTSPPFIDYYVCGFPQADECGYVITLCDTFRVYTLDSLIGSVTPNPGTFCQLGPGSGVTLNANAIGGNSNYSYTWYDNSGALVGTGPSYFATSQQNYTVEVNDGLSGPNCAANFLSVPVIETSEPIVDAGVDQLLCPNVNQISLTGSVTYTSGSFWSGGDGTFSPDSSYLSCNYIPTSAEIASGMLELYLTSTGAGGSCPNVTDTIQISFPNPIDIQLTDTTLLCSDDIVSLVPAVSGGVTPYNYLWSNGMSTPSILVSQGTFCLTITDALGCIESSCANVTAPNQLTVVMNSNPTTTNGGTDGDATATPFGGTPPYSYSWAPGGGTTSAITGLEYGIYIVTVTDDNGCSVEGSVVVNEPRCLGFSASTTVDSVSCYNDNTATASAIVIGGTMPYSYQWDDPLEQTNSTITNLEGGLYSVTVTDDNGCFAIAVANVYEPNQLVNSVTSTNATSVGGNDGSATANPFGGTPPYTYFWSTGDNTQTVNGLFYGTFYLTVTDANGCAVTDSVFINEPPCNSFMLYASGTNLTCNNSNDGTASVFVAGGTEPYSILWSNSATTSSVSNLIPGNYTVEVTDANNCYSFQTITITQPDSISTATLVNDISCNGAGDGTVDLVVVGGSYPYTYTWSNGAVSEDLVWLNQGTYSVIISDANGCMGYDTVTIAEPQIITTSNTYTNVTCYSDSNATIDLTVNGGVFPYSYTWSTGDTVQDLNNIPAGLYWVNVHDANNCALSSAINILIEEPEVVALDSFYIHCPVPGDTLAMVDFYPTGGTSPYQISTDNGNTFLPYNTYSTSLVINNTYHIMINDSNNCTSSYMDTIEINPAVVVDSVVFEQCYIENQTLSEVNVFPSGGTSGSYQVSFDNGGSFQVAGDYSNSLLINNTYYIVVMDSAGCLSVTNSIVIPDRLTASALITSNFNGQDIACFGDTNGTAQANQTGGEGPYNYAWSNGQVGMNAINLGVGNYVVTVTDNNGCFDTANVSLSQPNPLSNKVVITTSYNGYDVSCNGNSDGSANVNTIGGTQPYSFLWNNGQTDLTAINLGAGFYTVQITDANGCIDSNSVTLNEPSSIQWSVFIGHVQCNSFTDGEIDLSVIGGVPPFMFNWSTGATTEDIKTVGAGSYTVNVTDLNGCVVKDIFEITEEFPLVLTTTQQNVSCYGLNDGSIDLNVSGGVLPYEYSWNTGDLTEDIDNLSAGTYYVLVTDSNDCFINDPIIITQPNPLQATIESAFYQNGHNVTLFQMTDGGIDLTVTGGTLNYTFDWSNGATTEDLMNVGAGTYSVVITDKNGCTYSTWIELTEPFALEMPTVITVNGDGKNDQFLINGLESFPENTLVIFNRWGDQVYEMTNYDNQWDGIGSNGNALPPGNYYVILNINSGQIILNGFVEIIR